MRFSFLHYRPSSNLPAGKVEVSGSALEFDVSLKARLYARAGIAEYRYRSMEAYAEAEFVATLAAPTRTLGAGELFG